LTNREKSRENTNTATSEVKTSITYSFVYYINLNKDVNTSMIKKLIYFSI